MSVVPSLRKPALEQLGRFWIWPGSSKICWPRLMLLMDKIQMMDQVSSSLKSSRYETIETPNNTSGVYKATKQGKREKILFSGNVFKCTQVSFYGRLWWSEQIRRGLPLKREFSTVPKRRGHATPCSATGGKKHQGCQELTVVFAGRIG